jgi:hypothetical protein
MSTVYDELDETLIGFIRRQKLFFGRGVRQHLAQGLRKPGDH